MTKDIETVFKEQQEHKFQLRASTAQHRIEKLKALKAAVQQAETAILSALKSDLGKHHFEAAVTEVFFVYSEIDFAIKHLRRWMRPKRVSATMSNIFSKNRIYYEPRGVCLIIAPWNYPFQLVMSPLISAIAAGNCVMVKPSEISAATSAVINKIISATFEKREIACLEGDAEISKKLLNLPFDHIFFTGSTAIGKLVMEAAAAHLTTVTLELGGKSPAIVGKNTNIQKAAQKIAWGKLVNAGQTCIAPDYVLIEESKLTTFIEAYKKYAQEMFSGSASDAYGKIISPTHLKRLVKLIDDARAGGATIAFGGNYDLEKLTLDPTILINVSPESIVMQEEIFGPVLPVLTFKAIDEAVTIINRKSKPLSLYIFDEDKSTVASLIAKTSAGGTCVNNVLVHISNPHLPFGGVNSSGTGSCHGVFGFKTFSHERAVMIQSAPDFTNLVYPPYEGKNWVLNLLRKIM